MANDTSVIQIERTPIRGLFVVNLHFLVYTVFRSDKRWRQLNNIPTLSIFGSCFLRSEYVTYKGVAPKPYSNVHSKLHLPN